MSSIPYGRQSINKPDLAEVSKALKNDKITTGKIIVQFEQKLKKYFNSKYVSTCNSGTSALFLALLSIGVKKNDVIIMPAINFIASYNVAKHLNAKVYLADVNKYTGQITPKSIQDICEKFKIKNIKAIIVMYNGGSPLYADEYKKLKKKYKSYIIEDACHALGSYYIQNNKKIMIGSCKHCDISTFSLHPLKTITTGEGGIVTTNNKGIFEKINLFRSLGIVKNKNNHWDYDVILKGFNFRLNDFQSALGLSQLKRVNSFLKKRKLVSKIYDKHLKNIEDIYLPLKSNKYFSSNHLYLINLKNKNIFKKNAFLRYMIKNKVMVQYHYIPIFKFKIFHGKYIGNQANEYYKSTLSLPIYADLKFKEQLRVIKLIRKFFKK